MLDAGNLPAEIKSFVPAGYDVLNATSGDLNRDAFADVILVLNKPNERETSNVGDEPEKRPLLILLGESGNKFKFAARNDEVVLCVTCGGVFGDPFEGITIKSGYFSVEHYGGSAWRWTKTITFKYSPAIKNWLLSSIGSESFHALDPDNGKSTIKTPKNFGKSCFEKYDGYNY